jgi:hypothetical protein
MTSYDAVYDAFHARILEDEWENWLIAEAESDWRQILEMALPHFKFPRVDLTHDEKGFSGDLGQEEIQIIANFMKCEWLNRCIMTWDNIKPLYVERDFSQANLLDKLQNMLESELTRAKEIESIYYRSRKGRPFNFSKLATKA